MTKMMFLMFCFCLKLVAGVYQCPADSIDDYMPNPENCQKYFRCMSGSSTPMSFQCGPGTAFNVKSGTCDWPHMVPGCDVTESGSSRLLGAASSPQASTQGASQWDQQQHSSQLNHQNPGQWNPRQNTGQWNPQQNTGQWSPSPNADQTGQWNPSQNADQTGQWNPQQSTGQWNPQQTSGQQTHSPSSQRQPNQQPGGNRWEQQPTQNTGHWNQYPSGQANKQTPDRRNQQESYTQRNQQATQQPTSQTKWNANPIYQPSSRWSNAPNEIQQRSQAQKPELNQWTEQQQQRPVTGSLNARPDASPVNDWSSPGAQQVNEKDVPSNAYTSPYRQQAPTSSSRDQQQSVYQHPKQQTRQVPTSRGQYFQPASSDDYNNPNTGTKSSNQKQQQPKGTTYVSSYFWIGPDSTSSQRPQNSLERPEPGRYTEPQQTADGEPILKYVSPLDSSNQANNKDWPSSSPQASRVPRYLSRDPNPFVGLEPFRENYKNVPTVAIFYKRPNLEPISRQEQEQKPEPDYPFVYQPAASNTNPMFEILEAESAKGREIPRNSRFQQTSTTTTTETPKQVPAHWSFPLQSWYKPSPSNRLREQQQQGNAPNWKNEGEDWRNERYEPEITSESPRIAHITSPRRWLEMNPNELFQTTTPKSDAWDLRWNSNEDDKLGASGRYVAPLSTWERRLPRSKTTTSRPNFDVWFANNNNFDPLSSASNVKPSFAKPDVEPMTEETTTAATVPEGLHEPVHRLKCNETHLECGSEKYVDWVEFPGVTFKSEVYEAISSKPDSIALDCFQRCARINCTAYSYNKKIASCYLFGEPIDVADVIVSEDYNSVLPDQFPVILEDEWLVTTDAKLLGAPTVNVEVANISSCLELCEKFHENCQAFAYSIHEKECSVFGAGSSKKAGILKDHVAVQRLSNLKSDDDWRFHKLGPRALPADAKPYVTIPIDHERDCFSYCLAFDCVFLTIQQKVRDVKDVGTTGEPDVRSNQVTNECKIYQQMFGLHDAPGVNSYMIRVPMDVPQIASLESLNSKIASQLS